MWCTGFSSQWLLLLHSTGSKHAGFSSCGSLASLVVAHGLSCSAACGIILDQGSIEPVSPALAGGFLTTAPPGKSLAVSNFENEERVFCWTLDVGAPLPTS